MVELPALGAVVDALDRSVRHVVDRLRRLPHRAWHEPAHAPGWTGLHVVEHLATAWSTLAQCAEQPDGALIRPLPSPRYAAGWTDVLAVVGNDAVLALRELAPSSLVQWPHGMVSAEQLAAVALAEGLVHGWDILGGRVDDEAAAIVIAVLGVDAAPTGAGLLAARGRGGAAPVWDDWVWEPIRP